MADDYVSPSVILNYLNDYPQDVVWSKGQQLWESLATIPVFFPTLQEAVIDARSKRVCSECGQNKL